MNEYIHVALGDRRYRVERPFGDLPAVAGRVSDVACCSKGHVFVLFRYDAYVDRRGPAVVELDPTGRRVAAWGDDLVFDGHMLAIDAADRVFIVDRDAHEIIICDRHGQRLGGLGTRHAPGAPFNHPTDVAFAPNGEILVADGYAGASIHRFSADGAFIGSWGRPGHDEGAFKTPHAVWAMTDGRVVVADRDNDRIQVFDSEGRHLATWLDHVRPMAVWSDAAGTIYVTDQVPRMSMLAPDGGLLGRCRPVLNGAHGGCLSIDGHMYLAEVNPSRITRLVPK